MGVGTKRKLSQETVTTRTTTTKAKVAKVRPASAPERDTMTVPVPYGPDMDAQLQRIAASDRTAFEKRVWSLLCQIPAGQFSTYGLMSAHLGSSPRAIGNAMRRNPFAPGVPCHRCVATGGKLGGFKGQWPRNGEGVTLDEKRGLLRREGVRFDDAGRVLGTPLSACA